MEDGSLGVMDEGGVVEGTGRSGGLRELGGLARQARSLEGLEEVEPELWEGSKFGIV